MGFSGISFGRSRRKKEVSREYVELDIEMGNNLQYTHIYQARISRRAP